MANIVGVGSAKSNGPQKIFSQIVYDCNERGLILCPYIAQHCPVFWQAGQTVPPPTHETA